MSTILVITLGDLVKMIVFAAILYFLLRKR